MVERVKGFEPEYLLKIEIITRMCPPCEPGPAQGFFMLKESFFPRHCADLGVLALAFGLCKAPRDNFVVKKALYK